ncbi:hypothetical protein Dimus_019902, partial [Dionaea muscipula]
NRGYFLGFALGLRPTPLLGPSPRGAGEVEARCHLTYSATVPTGRISITHMRDPLVASIIAFTEAGSCCSPRGSWPHSPFPLPASMHHCSRKGGATRQCSMLAAPLATRWSRCPPCPLLARGSSRPQLCCSPKPLAAPPFRCSPSSAPSAARQETHGPLAAWGSLPVRITGRRQASAAREGLA